MNKNEQNNALVEADTDLYDLEAKLEQEILAEMNSFAELKEQQAKIGTPDSLGDTLMNTVWEQFELQIANHAREEFNRENKGLTLDLRDEAHIQTTENFANGKIATHNTKIDYSKRYDDWQANLQKDENGNIMTHKTRSGREEATLVKGARNPFDASRPSGSAEKNTDMDHTISAGEIIRDPAANAHLSKEEQIDFANSEDNLNEMDSSLNRSKGDTPMEEWLDNPNSKGQKPKDIFGITDEDDKNFRKNDKKARKAYKKKIKGGEKRSIETGKQSKREEAVRAGKQSLKALAESLLKDLLKKIAIKFVSWLKNGEKKLKALLGYMKEALTAFVNDFEKNVISSLKTSALSIASMILGPISRTLTKAYSFIKQGWSSLKQAYDCIVDPENKDKPASIMFLEVSKIIVAGISGAGAIALGEVIEKTLMPIPLFAIEIPMFGSAASMVGLFLGAVCSGIIGALALNLINYFISKKVKNTLSEQRVDKGNLILQKQSRLLNAVEAKLDNGKKKAANDVNKRHHDAVRHQREAIAHIFDNSEQIKKKHDTLRQHKEAADSVNLDAKFDEINNRLDMLLNKQ